MTVDTYCQITFISTWMIHKLHKLNMFRTELIITPPHLHLFLLLSSSFSWWLAWPVAQAPSSLTPVPSSHIVNLSSVSDIHPERTLLHTCPLYSIPLLQPVLGTFTFHRKRNNRPLMILLETQSSSMSSGSLSAE